LEKKKLAGTKENYFYLEFVKDGNIRKLYSTDKTVVDEWF
jgi:hypothetical protein